MTAVDPKSRQQALMDQYIVDYLDLVDILVEPGDDGSMPIDPGVLRSQPCRSRMAFKLGLRRIVSDSVQELSSAFENSLALIDRELATRTSAH